MNWQQRSGQIYSNLLEQGKRSIRAIATATGIAKSSVHRQMQAIARRCSVCRITLVGTSEWLGGSLKIKYRDPHHTSVMTQYTIV